MNQLFQVSLTIYLSRCFSLLYVNITKRNKWSVRINWTFNMRSLQESQWRSKRAQKNYKFTANSKRKFPTNETENCFISANLLKIQNHSKNYCTYFKNWSVYRTRSYSCNICNYSLLFFVCNLRQGIGIINLLCWFITTHGTACERKIT